MLDLLIAVGIVIPGWYAYKRSVSHGLVSINHVTTFTFGFLFYWIAPICVGLYGSRLASQASEVYFRLFDKAVLAAYLGACIGLYLCFMVGDWLGLRLFRSKEVFFTRVPKLALSLITAAGIVLALYTAYTLRAELLLPYSTELTFSTARGALATCILLMGVVALIYAVEHPRQSWVNLAISSYFIPIIFGAAVLLWLGNRLYVVSFVLMFAVYQTNLRKRLRLRTVLFASLTGAVLVGVHGVLREQGNIGGAFLNVVREPILTSLSLTYHLRRYGISWINSPVYLASDFVNLLPSLLFPGKASLLKKLPVFNPLGGTHSFVSFDLNFGVCGSAIVLFLLPIALRYLKSRSSGTVFAVAYVMLTGWLAFTFFRDPFQISLVKAMLQAAVLMPIAVVAFGRLLAAACSRGMPVSDVPETRPQAI